MSEGPYFLGIDPGVRNCGVGLIDSNGSYIASAVFDMKEKSIPDAIYQIKLWVEGVVEESVSGLCIERYVSYNNKVTAEQEHILMIIGALVFSFAGTPTSLFRALDWKRRLCQLLVKEKGFSNPSTSFDKEASMAMCEASTGALPHTDHEGDALCLAYCAYQIWKNSDEG